MDEGTLARLPDGMHRMTLDSGRRVVAKVEVTPSGSQRRFVVTNLEGTPEAVYRDFYVQRGKDPSWLDQYPDVIRGLTLDQVNGAIKKHLNPDEMYLIKAGTVPGAMPDAKK